MTESDPLGIPPGEPGSKLDAGKATPVAGVLHYFPRAIIEVAAVSAYGARKYMWNGWESVPDGAQRYTEALGRHLIAERLGAVDADSGLLHAAQVAWNALARLELLLRDRGT
jgi:hypothetical protein